MERTASDSSGRPVTVLDRTIDLGAVSWAAIGWAIVLATAVAVRLGNLDVWGLSPAEAYRTYHAFAFYEGRPSLPGADLPTTAPLFLLLQAFGFFLFGATDATARIAPALLGLGMLGLIGALRPFVGRPAALGMAAVAALSPTLVWSSRTAQPEIAVAFCALLLVVAVLRSGLGGSAVRRWALGAGAALGALIASGPSSISVLIALGAGAGLATVFDRARASNDDPDAPPEGEPGATVRGLRALFGSGETAGLFGIGAFVALAACFTRLFSDIPALSGLATTFADWGRLLGNDTSPTSSRFFLLAILLYEIMAVVFAVVAVYSGRLDGDGALGWTFFAGWFAAALVLFSFSAGSTPDHAVHVALPLVLLAGGAIGDLFAAVNWRNVLRGPGGLLILALLGVFVASVAFAVLIGRTGEAVDEGRATVQAVVAGLIVVLFGVAAYGVIRNPDPAARVVRPGAVVLLVVLLVLGAYSLRSTVLLNFYEADEGRELLAQETATAAVQPLVARVTRLSRDVTVAQGSVRDPTGGNGLGIAVDQRLQWPFRWYFRQFPDLQVVAAGQAPLQTSQVVIAPDRTGMADAGYTPFDYPYVNRVPATYQNPDILDVVRHLVVPGNWLDGTRYLLYRDLETDPDPTTIAVGFNAELSARLIPNSGPFDLFDRAGQGRGRGQLDRPRGIAVAPDGSAIYVVDQDNLRVQTFDADGRFVGIWGGDGGGYTFGTQFQQGPSGIATGADGLIYVADTWNHRIVVFDASGAVIRQFGENGDTGGSPTAAVPNLDGKFFGPRGVAVDDGASEVYVVDTGNERVQVFGPDGSFKRTFGGNGSGPNQLLEPVGIALGPDGRVYVADTNNGRISVWDKAGNALDQWPVPAWIGSTDFSPYLTFGLDGNLYATSANTGSVEVLGSGGEILSPITQVGNELLQAPVGIATAPDGAILITDQGSHAVYRYQPAASAPAPLIPNQGQGQVPPQGEEVEIVDPPLDATLTSETLPEPPVGNG